MKTLTSLLMGCTFLLNLPSLIAQQFTPQSNPHSSASTTAPSIHWIKNYSEAVAISQSHSKPIAILFTGTGWCPACMKLEREVLGDPEFVRAVGQQFIFLKADFSDPSPEGMNNSPYKPLLDHYQIQAFPTIVVINSNGELLYKVNYQSGGHHIYVEELLRKLHQVEEKRTMQPS
jgi:thiol:disulfide interchange protein